MSNPATTDAFPTVPSLQPTTESPSLQSRLRMQLYTPIASQLQTCRCAPPPRSTMLPGSHHTPGCAISIKRRHSSSAGHMPTKPVTGQTTCHAPGKATSRGRRLFFFTTSIISSIVTPLIYLSRKKKPVVERCATHRHYPQQACLATCAATQVSTGPQPREAPHIIKHPLRGQTSSDSTDTARRNSRSSPGKDPTEAA